MSQYRLGLDVTDASKALTDQAPWNDANGLMAIYAGAMNRRLPAILTEFHNIPWAAKDLMRRCWSFNPEARPSMASCQADLLPHCTSPEAHLTKRFADGYPLPRHSSTGQAPFRSQHGNSWTSLNNPIGNPLEFELLGHFKCVQVTSSSLFTSWTTDSPDVGMTETPSVTDP